MAVSEGCRLFLMQNRHIRNVIAAIPTTPPMTAPTMTPVLGPPLEEESFDEPESLLDCLTHLVVGHSRQLSTLTTCLHTYPSSSLHESSHTRRFGEHLTHFSSSSLGNSSRARSAGLDVPLANCTAAPAVARGLHFSPW